MNLLALLNELEPDAGWRAVPCVKYVRSLNTEAYLNRVRELNTWRAILVNPECYTRVEALHEDRKTALKMALTGYRAGETR